MAERLTVREFERRYQGEKPYYEYWDGEAVQKISGTYSHSQAQSLAGYLLYAAQWHPLIEVDVRIDPQYIFIPDLVGDSARCGG